MVTPPVIQRDPQAAHRRSFDLIVVGGGIYGALTALEAARRRLRPLLIERNDFGGATSWNSLRIVHGGLRYLQTLDLRRFRESVGERRWFLRHFPDLVEPLPCLMPLYGRGLRRPAILRLALRLNDRLSSGRNWRVRADRALPDGRVIGPDEVIQRFPAVHREGLQGAALWHDATMINPARLLIETLRWACGYGTVALNYVEATALRTEGGRAAGVVAVDRVSGDELEFQAPVVINCAGPWNREVAARLDRDVPWLFQPSLAFNLLLDRAPLADAAVAVAPRATGAPIYFIHRWRDRALAGTYHAPWAGPPAPAASAEQVEGFIADLNAAVPGWDLSPRDVVRVLAGLLPVRTAGTTELSTREVIHAHREHGGPAGLYSVSGVKFTTARLVAERVIRRAFPNLSHDRQAFAHAERPMPAPVAEAEHPGAEADLQEEVARVVREEGVVHPDDLFLRRTDWGLDPRRSEALRGIVPSGLPADGSV